MFMLLGVKVEDVKWCSGLEICPCGEMVRVLEADTTALVGLNLFVQRHTG